MLLVIVFFIVLLMALCLLQFVAHAATGETEVALCLLDCLSSGTILSGKCHVSLFVPAF